MHIFIGLGVSYARLRHCYGRYARQTIYLAVVCIRCWCRLFHARSVHEILTMPPEICLLQITRRAHQRGRVASRAPKVAESADVERVPLVLGASPDVHAAVEGRGAREREETCQRARVTPLFTQSPWDP